MTDKVENDDVRDDSAEVDTIDSEETVDDWTPPTREEYEDLLAKKKRADSEAASRKRWLRDNGFDPKTGEKLGKTTDEKSDDETDASVKVLREKAIAFKTKTLVTEIPFALTEAGIPTDKHRRAMAFLDMTVVDVDSDGELDGLAEQIESLRVDFPEFFKRTRMKDVASAKTVGAGNKTTESTKTERSWEDQVRDWYNGK